MFQVSSKPSKRYLRRITAAAWIVSVWLCRALMDRYNRHQRIIIHLITEVVQYRVLLIPLWIKPCFLAIEMHVTRVFNWMRMYIRKKIRLSFSKHFYCIAQDVSKIVESVLLATRRMKMNDGDTETHNKLDNSLSNLKK